MSICETTPAAVTTIPYTYPTSDASLVSALEAAVTAERTAGNTVRVAVFDTIVSMPGVRVPFEALTATCRRLGILSCIDAAHCVGQLDVDLTALDPDFFVSNLHKWLFVPRGCAVLYVPERNQALMRTTFPTGHGFNAAPGEGEEVGAPSPPYVEGETAFTRQFDFLPTIDYSPYLCVPAALAFRENVCGGEAAIRAYCSALAIEAGDRTAEIFGTEVLENDEGTLRKGIFMVNVRLPLDPERVELDGRGPAWVVQWLGTKMVEESETFMAAGWSAGEWFVRWSAQVYLELEDFEWGAGVLLKLCERVRNGEHLE